MKSNENTLLKANTELVVFLGSRIDTIRKEKGLTLEQLGLNCDKDFQNIHRLIKGKVAPTIVYLAEVCKGLDITLEELFKDILIK